MMNFFKLAANDMSLIYLGKVFGPVGGLLPVADGVTEVNLFSSMFATFNTIVLAIGALIIVYMTVIGVMATAHEGEFMGKKWNNIWIPIRTVMGVAVLVPTASGYSALQYVLMWVVVQGVAAADTIWSTVLTTRAVTGSAYNITLPDAGVKSDIKNLFQGLVCDATSRRTDANPSGVSKGGYYCHDNTCSSPVAFDPATTTMSLGPNGVCGQLTACNVNLVCTVTDSNPNAPNSLKCLACQAQLSALASIIPTLSVGAERVAYADYTYRDFIYHSYNQPNNPNWQPIYDYCDKQNPVIPKEACCKSSATSPTQTCQGATTFPPEDSGDGLTYQNPSDDAVKNVYWPYFLAEGLTVPPAEGGGASDVPVDFLSAATDAYMGELNAAYAKYVQLKKDNPNAYDEAKISILGIQVPAGQLFQQADDLGWVFGGVFYYLVATNGGTASNISDAVPDLSIDLTAAQSYLKNYRTNMATVDPLMDAAEAASSMQPAQFKINITSGVPKLAKIVLAPIQEGFNALNTALSKVLSAVGVPLVGLSYLGQIMVLTGTLIYGAVFLLSAFTAMGSLVNVYAMGTGADSPFYGFALVMSLFIMPLLYLLTGWFIGFGGMLCVYLPLIPYIVFTFGAIGWFIGVIEAMIAAPLVALGILSPSGQHELMGKAEPAILMMLNVFLRPSLMLFGMIAAMLLSVVVVEFIFNSFGLVIMFATGGGAFLNPVVLVLFLSLMIILIVAALNKCFAMIHIIPQQVMQWIGGHHMPGTSGGEEALLGEVKGGVKSGTGAISGGAQKAIGAAGEFKQKMTKKHQEQQGATISAATGGMMDKIPGKGDGE